MSAVSRDETFYHVPTRMLVNGGAGNDTYIIRNTSQRYDWKASHHGLELTHKVSNNSVLLLNIETVKFTHDDVTLTFTSTRDCPAMDRKFTPPSPVTAWVGR